MCHFTRPTTNGDSREELKFWQMQCIMHSWTWKLQKNVANSDWRRTSRRPKQTEARGKNKIGEFYGHGKTSLYCHFMLASLKFESFHHFIFTDITMSCVSTWFTETHSCHTTESHVDRLNSIYFGDASGNVVPDVGQTEGNQNAYIP